MNTEELPIDHERLQAIAREQLKDLRRDFKETPDKQGMAVNFFIQAFLIIRNPLHAARVFYVMAYIIATLLEEQNQQNIQE